MRAVPSLWFVALAALAASATAQATSSIYTVTSTLIGGSGTACVANSTTDPDCTLDKAITTAAAGDIIQFAAAVQGETITVTSTLALAQDVTIDATPNGVTLDGNNTSPIFQVNGAVNIVPRRLTVQHGNAGAGSTIYSDSGHLTIDSCTFANNTTTGNGAALASGGTLVLLNSTFAGNQAGGSGGALFLAGSSVIAYSSFVGNTGSGGVGAMYILGTVQVLSSLFAGNNGTFAPTSFGGLLTSLGHNLVDDTTNSSGWGASGDQLDVHADYDPGLLADNGGPTQTVALLSTSLARSGGDCSGHASAPAIDPVAVDQRGFTRNTPCTTGAFDMQSVFYDAFDTSP